MTVAMILGKDRNWENRFMQKLEREAKVSDYFQRLMDRESQGLNGTGGAAK